MGTNIPMVVRGLLTVGAAGLALAAGPAYAQSPTYGNTRHDPAAPAGARTAAATLPLVTYDVPADIDGRSQSQLTMTGDTAPWLNIENAAPGPHNFLPAVSARWRIVYQNRLSGLFDTVVANNRADAWAAGGVYRGNTLLPVPYLFRWGGRVWRRVTVPGAKNVVIEGLAASSARNVWLFGQLQDGALDPAKVFRWDGVRWHELVVPPLLPIGVGNEVVLGQADVWLLGGGDCIPGPPHCTADLRHWNGTAWKQYTVPINASDIAAVSPTDVWVVGVTGQTTASGPGRIAAFRWNGRRWVQAKLPHITARGPSIAMSGSQVWLNTTSGDAEFVLHWNGSRWHRIGVPQSLFIDGPLVPDGRRGVWVGPFAHWTGRAWRAANIPANIVTLGVCGFARVPGTSSYWAGSTANESLTDPVTHPTILVYGPIP